MWSIRTDAGHEGAEIVTATLDAIQNRRAKALRINLANGDMVGHTGVYGAALRRCSLWICCRASSRWR